MRTDRKMRSAAAGRATLVRLLILLALGLCAAPPAVAQETDAATAAGPIPDRVITGDHAVEEGEVVNDIAVVGGTLTVRGEVAGDAVVVGGDLVLRPTGTIRGGATVTGGRIVREGGRVLGEMKTLESGAAAGAGAGTAAESRRAARDVEASERAERRRSENAASEPRMERDVDASHRGRSWFDPIRRGFADLVSTVALGLVLGGIGAVLVFYGRPYLETVSDTLRTSTLRSVGVGLAAGFLIVPAFVVMIVALAVSIVGIPVLVLAVPLYPLAIITAAALGLLGAAHAIGERTAEQKGAIFTRTGTNSYSYLFTGIAMLLTPLVIASLVEMIGFLGFVATILKLATWAAIWVVTTAGFGAVILSRAGTRRAFIAPPVDPILGDDPFFDPEPSTRTPGG